ncbi:hypothetical protein A3I84_01175 [Candidatus Nomurabacteria bacterium RIFCSPLOWO2_02_FULL_36_8]|nr:MAG: hypothetical protein A3I84_01175 [Candidatus Nomurabacteria bacterium RIFCSPLOWO2_02_FULL_36_8]
MTIDKLAVLMKVGFEGVNKKIENEIDDLAKMIKEDVVDRMATKTDIEELKNKIEGIDKRIDDFATNKVDYDKFNPLVKRVEALEKA